MSKNITIAGLGWLGLSLALHLRSKGYTINGSVTEQHKASSLRRKGIACTPVLFTENGIIGEVNELLAQTEVLISLIPPGLRNNSGANYALKMAHFLEAIETMHVKKVILISSTSVYADEQGKVTENDRPNSQTNAGRQLREVEQLFFNASGIETTIVRFGGLVGGSRNPVKYLAGRTGLSNGNAPVNLIHREDCIGIITEIIAQEAFGVIFNAVAPSHPTKATYYKNQALRLHLKVPTYNEPQAGEVYKQVDSIQLQKILQYDFKHLFD